MNWGSYKSATKVSSELVAGVTEAHIIGCSTSSQDLHTNRRKVSSRRLVVRFMMRQELGKQFDYLVRHLL